MSLEVIWCSSAHCAVSTGTLLCQCSSRETSLCADAVWCSFVSHSSQQRICAIYHIGLAFQSLCLSLSLSAFVPHTLTCSQNIVAIRKTLRAHLHTSEKCKLDNWVRTDGELVKVVELVSFGMLVDLLEFESPSDKCLSSAPPGFPRIFSHTSTVHFLLTSSQ